MELAGTQKSEVKIAHDYNFLSTLFKNVDLSNKKTNFKQVYLKSVLSFDNTIICAAIEFCKTHFHCPTAV